MNASIPERLIPVKNYIEREIQYYVQALESARLENKEGAAEFDEAFFDLMGLEYDLNAEDQANELWEVSYQGELARFQQFLQELGQRNYAPIVAHLKEVLHYHNKFRDIAANNGCSANHLERTTAKRAQYENLIDLLTESD
jgi:hypothetical protein